MIFSLAPPIIGLLIFLIVWFLHSLHWEIRNRYRTACGSKRV